MKKYLFSIGILFTLTMNSQNSITGLVKGDSEPIAYANSILFKASDSSFVKGVISQEDGSFEFDRIPDGIYFITASMMGYYNVDSSIFELKDNINFKMPDIILSEQIVLDEVVMKVEKQLYEQKVDRMVINVESSILSAGSTALEVLERSPGVIVDRQSNAISLVGKNGVTVMINGKISYLPQESILQLLDGTSSDNIKSIELITTPPANLDAEGNAGFINIVLKERTDVGLNGSYSLSLGVGNGTTTNDNINFNYRKGKINVYGNYSFQRRAQGSIWSFSRSFTDQQDDEISLSTDTHRDPVQRNHNVRIGVDYEVSEKTVIGMILSAYDNKWSMDAITNSEQTTNGVPSEFTEVFNEERNQWTNFGANFNLKHNFKENGFISVDYDYLNYDNENPNDYINNYYDGDGNFLYQELTKSDKITPINISVIAADYNNQITKDLKLEFGAKGAFTHFENDVYVGFFDGTDYVEDDELTNKSNLDERILAAYSSADYNISEKISAKMGLRYEHTLSKLDTDKEGTVVDRSFGELFPSVFFSYNVNDSLNMNLSYSRRITRPTFSQMAPFVIFFDPNTFFAGNTAIQPSISNSITAGTNYKSFVLSAQYTLEKGTISRGEARFDAEKERLIWISDNIDQVSTFSLTLGLPFRITDWWKSQNTLIFLNTRIENAFDDYVFKTDQNSFNINSTQSFTMSGNWSSELNFNYFSPRIRGTNKVEAAFFMNLGIMKKFGDKWGSLRFNINDIFESREYVVSTETELNNLKSNATLRFSNRTFMLTYTRSFGNKKLKSTRSRSTGAEEEKNRVN
jgi:outer membrane receptor protein involved in Fe transport